MSGMRVGRLTSARTGLLLACGAVLLFLLAPTLLIIPVSLTPRDFLEFPPSGVSLRWYEAYFTDPDWVLPTLFSLQIAVLTALTATFVGTAAALALSRGQVPARGLLQTLVLAPMIAPVIVVAIAALSLLLRLGLLGSTLGFVLAHSVLAMPFVVLTVSAALARFDPNLELAALSLGASRLVTLRRVTLPVIRPAILSGATLAFLTSFDEAVVSFYISSVQGTTLPKRLFENIAFSVSPIIAAISTLLTALTMLALGTVLLTRLRLDARVARRAAESRPEGSPA